MLKHALLILPLLLLSGCNRPRPDQPPKPPPTETIFHPRLRPVVVTAGGDSHWTEAEIQEQLDTAKANWSQYGFEMTILDQERYEDADFFRVASLFDYKKLVFAASRYRLDRNPPEIAVFFIDSLIWFHDPTWPEGYKVYGVSQLPFMWPPDGVAIVPQIPEDVLAHELGHAFGLLHVWQDTCSDTPCEASTCSDPCGCNMMSYCWSKMQYCEPNAAFSPQQVAIARTQAYNEPRKSQCDVTGDDPKLPIILRRQRSAEEFDVPEPDGGPAYVLPKGPWGYRNDDF